MDRPEIIQGGMGIGVSNWRLASAVSKAGQLGVVSGTGIWVVLARVLQQGDPGGHIREALSQFPIPSIAQRIIRRYYRPTEEAFGKPFAPVPMLNHPLSQSLNEMLVAAGFAVVNLAKAGHQGLIGINLLEKIQLAHLPILYGAILAGVDYVLMGAGIPIQIAEALDLLSAHHAATYRLHVVDAASTDSYEATFEPAGLPWTGSPPDVRRPHFFPIVSTDTLARIILKRAQGEIDGFIIEGPTAGGHNAPPRGTYVPTVGVEPAYGAADDPDLGKFRNGFGKPFWLAGSFASPEALARAKAEGAAGIQLGSIFALSRESGLDEGLKRQAFELHRTGELRVTTNARCSPSGYPFKEAAVPGTLSDPAVYDSRLRLCDIGALRELYKRPDGKLGYRCPAEPLEAYVKKGGKVEDTEGRRCLCNTLLASIGLGQTRSDAYDEPALLTLGSQLDFLDHLPENYGVTDALSYLLGSA